ncbi:nuclear transport factor 2 family protein [Candidatus Pacearchaeota archaeon]|nr:nuclear transport factor 2 family protein [Candidatus Pacearchaeota archaeon]
MKPEEIALKFNSCINSQNIKGLSNLMSPNHRFIDSENGGFQGKEKAIKIWKEFFKKYPEYRNNLEIIKSRSNLIIMVGHSICSNKKLEGDGIWTAKIEHNKVAEWKVYYNTKDNRKLLGIE